MLPRILSLLCGAAVLAGAANHRALIMGIGTYPPGINSLPGISDDIARMRNLAELMGFEPSQIHVLQDSQVTTPRIRQEFQQFLSQAGPEDRVLIYYSGHGAFVDDVNGDEPDGQDELWVTYDTKVNSRNQLTGYLLDDEVDALINGLHSNNVLFVLDSCHSGSATRSLDYVIKSTPLRGEVESANRGISTVKARGNHVLLSACRDNETAAAGKQGSALTTALIGKAQQMHAQNRPLRLAELRAAIEPEVVRIKKDQHPSLSGSAALQQTDWFFGRGIQIVRPPQPQPPPEPAPVPAPAPDPPPTQGGIRSALNAIFIKASQRMTCRLNAGAVLKAGNTVDVTCDVPFEGYLNMVNIGDGDPDAITVFPNQFVQVNRVPAGRLALPSPERQFRVNVDLPPGLSRQKVELYFFLTYQNINFYSSSPDKGLEQFVRFTPSTARSLSAGAPGGYAAARIDLTIQK